MIDESSVPLERAAWMLNIDMESLITEIIELGIEVRHDRETGVDYITDEDFEELREIDGIID